MNVLNETLTVESSRGALSAKTFTDGREWYLVILAVPGWWVELEVLAGVGGDQPSLQRRVQAGRVRRQPRAPQPHRALNIITQFWK